MTTFPHGASRPGGPRGLPTDRRGAFVVLTAAGREAIEKAAPEHVGAVRQLVFDGLSKEQFTMLESFVSRVLSRLDAGAEAAPLDGRTP